MEALLEIKNLSKSFGRRKVIDDISLEVYGGEVFGFLGPNGAGKTTTIKMVMGFLFKDSGEIIINHVDQAKQYELAMSYLGGIVENPEMYRELSGRKNLEMYARLHRVPKARVDEVLALVGMTARAKEKVKKYSLGMKQRIGLAQALIHKPKVLILDEPTNGLDPVGIKELRDILKKVAHEEGCAVIVSSHMLSEMQLMCDRVGIISEGRIVGVKPIGELTAAAGKTQYQLKVSDAERAVSLIDETMHPALLEDGTVKIETDEEEVVAAVVRTLVGAGIDCFNVSKCENSLEDAYLEITGGGMDIA